MARTVIVWALILAAGAFALQWVQYQYVVRAFPLEIYIRAIGVAFAVWLGWRRSASTSL